MRFHLGFSLNWKTIKKFLIPFGIALAIYLGFNTMQVNAVSNIPVSGGTQDIYISTGTAILSTLPPVITGVNSTTGGNSQAISSSSSYYFFPAMDAIPNNIAFISRILIDVTNAPVSQNGIYRFIIDSSAGDLLRANADAFNSSNECYTIVGNGNVACSIISVDVTTSTTTIIFKSDVSGSGVRFRFGNLNNTPLIWKSATNEQGFKYTAYSLAQLSENEFNMNALLDQQKETNQKLDNLNEKQEQTNQNLNDLKEQEKETYDYLTDNTPPESDISSLGNVQGLLPPGPVDSLLNIPFQFLSVINSSFGGVCVPYTGDFVFDSTLTLPCFSEMFYDEVPPLLLNFLSLIPASFILMQYFKHLYKKVNRAVSMETNADDEWGVL